MVSDFGVDIEAAISSSRDDREATTRSRGRLALGVSAAVTVVWLIYVTASGQWGRVGDHWASALTMVFGSFVAGSTPQGGGAVAFPVFTKVLEIPAEVARSFSLAIQSVGMGAASAAILINRRRVELRALAVAFPATVIGFFIGYYLLTEYDQPFGPSVLPGPYVKVGFTLIVASMAFVTYLGYRVQLLEKHESLPALNARLVIALAACGLFGGIASALVGSGADVALYLGLVVLAGLSPRVGVATSVLLMTLISFLGLIMFNIADAHLGTGLNAAGDVDQLGSAAVAATADGVRFATGTALEGNRYDLFGLWLAAAPVVAWGAPLGSFVSSRVTDRRLVNAVVALAAIEVISTVVFLDELRSNPALAAFGVIGLLFMFGLLWFLKENRRRVLGLPPLDIDRALTRQRLDVGDRLVDDLDREEPR